MNDWVWAMAPLVLVLLWWLLGRPGWRRRAPRTDLQVPSGPPSSDLHFEPSTVQPATAPRGEAVAKAEAALREAQDSARREVAARAAAEAGAREAAARRQAAERAARQEAEQRAQAERLAAERTAREQAERAAEEARRRAAEAAAARARADREQQAREAAERAAEQEALAARERAQREAALREAAERQAAAEALLAREQAERQAEQQARERASAQAEAERLQREAEQARAALFPPPAPPAPPPAAVPAAPAPRRADDTLVMVADDSKVVRVKTSRLLAAHHFKVVLAEDGAQALALIDRELPQVLITDVEMPGLDGLALTRALRTDIRTAALPVVMITSADDRLKDEAAAAGVTVLMGKPYADADLVQHVLRLAGVSATA